MLTRPWKVLSLAIVAAAALLLLFGAGATSDTSEGANTYLIDGSTGKTWMNYPTTINLYDGDTLTIRASAGDPGGPRKIQIAQDANVTIIGDASKTFSYLSIYDSVSDTKAHNVNITNLSFTVDSYYKIGYTHNKGVLNLTGSNIIAGNGGEGIKSVGGSILTITSSSNGTLMANGYDYNGIAASNLIIGGNAKVHAVSTGVYDGVLLTGSNPSLKVEENATLTAGQTRGGIGYAGASTNTLNIECKGFITLRGASGIASTGNVIISGGGKIDYSSNGLGFYVVGNISIEKTTVDIASGVAVGMEIGPQVTLSNGATLSVSSHDKTVRNKTFIMAPGTTVNLSLGNTAAAGDTNTFIMSSPVNVWQLSGDMAFAGSSGPTSSPASIVLPGGKTGSVKLLPPSPPGITVPVPMTLTEGYAAASTGVFTITGAPAPNVTITSPDPKITWNDTTKMLDVATGLTAGSYSVQLTARNGISPEANITYTVTVNSSGGGTTPPGITGPLSMVLTAGYPASSSAAFTLSGNPAPTVSVTGDPKITWGADKLNIATGLAAGYYLVELTASNGTLPDAIFTFTLFVNPSGGTTPTVTGVSIDPTSASVAKGGTQTFSATVTGTGSPSQAVTWTVTGKTDANTGISPAGLLTVGAAETASSLSVKATSIYDPTKSNTVTVSVISGSSGGDGGEGGGGGNAILWVAIGVVIAVAAIGLLYFFVLKKKP